MQLRNNVKFSFFNQLMRFQKHAGIGIYLVFSLSFFASLAEGFGIILLLPIIELISTGTESSPPSPNITDLSLQLISIFKNLFGENIGVGKFLVIASTCFALKGVLNFLSLYLNAKQRGKLLLNLKKALFGAFNKMGYPYYQEKDVGYFTNILTEQTSRYSKSFSGLTLTVSLMLQALTYVSLAFFVAWSFGAFTFVVGLLLYLSFKRFNEYVKRLSTLSAAESNRLAKLSIQAMSSFKYLSATNKFETLKPKILTSAVAYAKLYIKTGQASAFTQSIREPISVSLILLIVYSQLVYFEQKLAPILISIAMFHRCMGVLLGMQISWQATLEHSGSIGLVESELARATSDRTGNVGTKNITFCDSIKIKDVSFTYQGSKCPAIESLNLTIPFGHAIGLVGASGSGKTTILDLLISIYKPTSGMIQIDNIAIDTIDIGHWKSNTGYVSQENVIFDDTIANNISLWSGDHHKEPELFAKIKTAAVQANILDWVQELPIGFDTIVGERGGKLSGGQKQRLFIARELFKNPKLLIMDEATSALDQFSEKRVQDTIRDLKGQTTIVMSTHRWKSIKNLDMICVVDKGKIKYTIDQTGAKISRSSKSRDSQILAKYLV